MAGQAPIIIIKKKKRGGHAAAHGGAWKVAYADFVTAMMCFFLVMWLMGADEEIKASISHYFNHPNTPYKSGRDPASQEIHPMGENAGSGDTVLTGQEGLFPDDLLQLPARPISDLQENRKLSEVIQDATQSKAYALDASIDSLSFAIPEKELFAPGSTKLVPGAEKTLTELGRVFKGYSGNFIIESHVDPTFKEGRISSFEFTLSRSVQVMHWMVEHGYIPSERVTPKGSGASRTLASSTNPDAKTLNSRVEFTLTKKKDVD